MPNSPASVSGQTALPLNKGPKVGQNGTSPIVMTNDDRSTASDYKQH